MSNIYIRHELLRHQAVRESTFYDWKYTHIDLKILAASGFYYEGEKDFVYCFSCNIKLSNIQNVYEIFERHKETYYCDFLKGKDVSIGRAIKFMKILGISLAPKKLENDMEDMFYDIYSPKLRRTSPSYLNGNEIFGAIKIPKVDCADMTLNIDEFFNFMKYEKNRLETFKIGHYNEVTPSPEYLSNNGFFYTLLNGVVQCAFCKIIFCGIQHNNIEFMHYSYSNNCVFIQSISNNIPLLSIPETIEDTVYNNINNRLLCKVCLENEVSVLLNCKHLVLCNTCSINNSLKTCPICRCSITSKCRIYLS